MRHAFLSLLLALPLSVPILSAAAGPLVSQQPSHTTVAQTSKPQTATKAKPAAPQMTPVNAEFVSYDAKKKTMTVKDDKGQTSSAKLEGKAVGAATRLHLKGGDHVMVTWRNNSKGEHQAITDVQPTKSQA